MIQTIACVLKSGGDFSAEHVARLHSMCNRHIPGRWEFVCLSDQVGPPGSWFRTGGITYKQLELDLPGWWSKLELFRPELFDGRVLYFDLDTVIVRDSAALGMWSGDFALLRDLWSPERWNTGVMAWDHQGEAVDQLWRDVPAIINEPDNADGQWMNSVVLIRGLNPEAIQDIDPGVCSFKPRIGDHATMRNDLDGTETVVCFHGQPRPWGEGAGNAKWISTHWI